MSNGFDVVVLGAGVVGGSVAYHLSREGHKVCLMDRDAVGSGASAHGHGSLSMAGKDFKPGPYFSLGYQGKLMFPEFVQSVIEDSGIDPLYHEKDGISLALLEEEEKIFKETMTWQSQHLEARWIDGYEARQLEPRITNDAIGGVLYSHGQVDGYRLSLALARGVEQNGGQVMLREATGLIRMGNRVSGVTYPGGEVTAGAVVISMGAWSEVSRHWLDFPVPVRPLHGEVMQVRLPGPPLGLFITTARHGPIFQRRDGTVLVGSVGGVSMTGVDVDSSHVFDPRETGPWEYDLQPSGWGRQFMLEQALKIMPALEHAEVLTHLAGVRPMCADRMPLIGPIPGYQGVYLATGHGTKGIHLSAITGHIISNLILEKNIEASVPVDAFSPERFTYLKNV